MTYVVAQTVRCLPAMQGLGFAPWVGKIPWRRKWQPTPVFLPGESHGQRSLAGYSPWGHKESDTTEQLHFHFQRADTADASSPSLPASLPPIQLGAPACTRNSHSGWEYSRERESSFCGADIPVVHSGFPPSSFRYAVCRLTCTLSFRPHSNSMRWLLCLIPVSYTRRGNDQRQRCLLCHISAKERPGI